MAPKTKPTKPAKKSAPKKQLLATNTSGRKFDPLKHPDFTVPGAFEPMKLGPEWEALAARMAKSAKKKK